MKITACSAWAAITCATLAAAPATAQQDQTAPENIYDDEIVVTAQRRAESVQDISASITALSGDDLVNSQTSNITDLGGSAPNLTIGQNFGQAQINVRGIGLDNLFTGADPSVSMHVDGAVIARPGAQLATFFDIERVEVLRGPQGTLYGRNATGGAINLITRKPTEETEGYGRFSVGNYDLLQFEGAIGGALISDMILGRVAVKIDRRDGYGRNIFLDRDVDNANKFAARAQLQFLLSNDLTFLLSADYQHEDDRDYQYKYRGPAFDDPTRPPTAFLYGGTVAADPRDVNTEAENRNWREGWSLTGTFDWTISDTLTARSITSYRRFRDEPRVDLDQTQVALTTSAQIMDSEQFSQEFQLLYEGDGFHAVAGAYYFNESLFGDSRTAGKVPPAAPPPIGTPSPDSDPATVPDANLLAQFKGTVAIDAAALFANATVEILPTIEMVAGGRYSWERRVGTVDRFKTPAVLLTGLEVEGEWDSFTPLIGLRWEPSNRLLVYGNYQRGFKSGIVQTGQPNPAVDPERVDAFEIGVKSRLFGGGLQLNLSAFHYKFKDQQVSRVVPIAPGVSQNLFENAAASTIKGIEAEAVVRILPGLRLEGFVSYLDARFSDYLTADPLLAGTPGGDIAQQLSGNRLVNAPEWSGTLKATYETSLGSWNVALSGEASAKSRIYFTAQNNPLLSQQGVTTYNAFLRFSSGDDRTSINFWMRNVTNELVFASSALTASARVIAGQYTPPRTFGVTLGYQF